MHLLEISIGISMLAVVLGRWILYSATKTLTDEEKARLLDASGSAIPERLVLILIIALFYYVGKYTSLSFEASLASYLVAIVVLLLISQSYRYRQMVANELPQSYRVRFVLSRVVTYGGLAIGLTLASHRAWTLHLEED